MKHLLQLSITICFISNMCIPFNANAQGCCVGGNCVTAANRTECEVKLGGVWVFGPCSPDACTKKGTCCYPTGCEQLTPAECQQKNGVFEGSGSCNNFCADPTLVGACCVYDLHGSFIRCVPSREADCKSTSANFKEWHPTACYKTQCPGTFNPTPSIFPLVEINPRFQATYIDGSSAVSLAWHNPFNDPDLVFFVARASDGKSFSTIGLLSSTNNGAEMEFTDNYPLTEGYYRVFYNRNGRDYASQTLAVFAVKSGKLVIVPNPATGKLRVLLAGMESFDTKVLIHDATGRLVLQKQLKRGQSPEIDLSTLPPGNFVVRAIQNGVVYVEKLMKH